MIGYDSTRSAAFNPPESRDWPECACGDEMAAGPCGLYCPSCDVDEPDDVAT